MRCLLQCTTLSLAFGLSALACGSCSSSSSKGSDEVKSSLARNTAPSDADVSTLTQGNAAFAFDLYHQASKAHPSDNFFFSPHSVSTALAMTYAGARGNTAKEMATTLHFTLPDAKLHTAFDALDLALSSRGQGPAGDGGTPFRLRVVDSLWGDTTLNILPTFLDKLAVNYGAGLRVLDFQGAPEPARVTINQWTSDQTEARIADLLPPNSIASDTRLVLVNAIYFNAAWASPFLPSLTASLPFTHLDGTTKNVDTMSGPALHTYVKGDGYEAVELPYAGDDAHQRSDTSMIVVLPTKGQWATFEPRLDGPLYEEIVAGLSTNATYASVVLPKFKIKGASISLTDNLSALGMTDVFTGSADFSGIASEPLFIGNVWHQVFISVDEKGTEAAAATAVDIDAGGMAGPPPPEFNANRPFFVFIRDIPTGALLFAGRVTDPG